MEINITKCKYLHWGRYAYRISLLFMRSIRLLGPAYLVASWAAREVGNRQDCNEFSSGAAITTVLMPPPWQWTIVAFNQSKHASNCAYYTPLYCNRYWFELKTKATVCDFHQNADKTRISHMAAHFSLFHLNEYISYRAHYIHNSPPKWLRNSPGNRITHLS